MLIVSTLFATFIISSCLITTSCSHLDKLIISGSNKITTFVNYNGEEDYDAINLKTTEPIKNGQWSLEGVDKDYFMINNLGALTWTSSSLTTIKDYQITLVCVAKGCKTTKKNIVVTNQNDPLPIATHISIYGSHDVTGVASAEGHSDYTATDSNGHRVVGAQWQLSQNVPSWLTINNGGLLHWTDSCTKQTIQFQITCSRDGLTSATFSATLTIGDDPIPPISSISIYGSTMLTGVGGNAGASDYVAIDSNGHKVTNGTWTLNKINGCDGVSVNNNAQVNWTNSAQSGTFYINCTSGSITGTSSVITLTINNPSPPNPGPMPTNCLEISSDGKTCYGIKADVDLSLYDEIDIPTGVEEIEASAFESKITSGYEYKIVLPDSLRNIQDKAFNNCVGIGDLNLGNGVQSIGRSAFDGLKRVKTLIVPYSVIQIGINAFSDMTDLCNLDFRPAWTNKNAWSMYYFDNDSKISNLVVNTNIFGINDGGASFFRSTHLSTLECFPTPLNTVLGNYAWATSIDIDRIIIHDGVTSIGQHCFDHDYANYGSYDPSTTTLSLPQSLTAIGDSAFDFRLKLDKLALPSNISQFEGGAFSNCLIKSINFSQINSCEFGVGDVFCPSYQHNQILNEIILNNRNGAPNWTKSYTYPIFDPMSSGNFLISGTWTDKQTIISWFNNFQGVGSTAFNNWTVNGA